MISSSVNKGLYIITHGCQMNVYDSERMADCLKPLGYKIVHDIGEACIVIVNTCHIREKAEEKLYSDLGRIALVKAKALSQGKEFFLIVAGCVAQAHGEQIQKRAPYVDIVVGPLAIHNIVGLLGEAMRYNTKLVDIDFPVESKFDLLSFDPDPQSSSSFISVQEGCDKFCTFCVVPFTRGPEFSRPVHDIIADVKKLVAIGKKEVTLLGQNVNAYHGDDNGKVCTLGKLIEHVASIDGLERIRYTTSHPLDMHDDLYYAHKNIPKLMPFLHLPVQSGSDKVLKAMNRKHTAKDYMDIIDKIRDACPGIAISSDFIVGFPGETEEDFCATLHLVEKVKFAHSFSFKYSKRPGTTGYLLDGQIDENIKLERLHRLQEVLYTHQSDFNKSFIGKTIDVLFSNQNAKEVIGKTPHWQTVCVQDKSLYNTITSIKIVDANAYNLTGIPC